MRSDETHIEGNLATVIVRNDHGPDPAYNQGQLYLEVGDGAFTGVDANELRDAIDKAVGKRKEEDDWRDGDRVEVDWLEGRTIVGRETVGVHAGRWVLPSGFRCGDDSIATLNPKAVGPRHEADPYEGTRPYRPVDRDRLLRHIEDLEATLTRRNERHEQGQERIRELEAEVSTLREIKDSCEEPKTPREYLDLAWEAATVPVDGMIYAGEEYVLRDIDGRVEGPLRAPVDRRSVTFAGPERRLLESRVEPAKEDLYRKDLESKGLAEWEIQLLVGAAK